MVTSFTVLYSFQVVINLLWLGRGLCFLRTVVKKVSTSFKLYKHILSLLSIQGQGKWNQIDWDTKTILSQEKAVDSQITCEQPWLGSSDPSEYEASLCLLCRCSHWPCGVMKRERWHWFCPHRKWKCGGYECAGVPHRLKKAPVFFHSNKSLFRLSSGFWHGFQSVFTLTKKHYYHGLTPQNGTSRVNIM